MNATAFKPNFPKPMSRRALKAMRAQSLSGEFENSIIRRDLRRLLAHIDWQAAIVARLTTENLNHAARALAGSPAKDAQPMPKDDDALLPAITAALVIAEQEADNAALQFQVGTIDEREFARELTRIMCRMSTLIAAEYAFKVRR